MDLSELLASGLQLSRRTGLTCVIVRMRHHKDLQGLGIPLVILIGNIKPLLPNSTVRIVERNEAVHIQHLNTRESGSHCYRFILLLVSTSALKNTIWLATQMGKLEAENMQLPFQGLKCCFCCQETPDENPLQFLLP